MTFARRTKSPAGKTRQTAGYKPEKVNNNTVGAVIEEAGRMSEKLTSASTSETTVAYYHCGHRKDEFGQGRGWFSGEGKKTMDKNKNIMNKNKVMKLTQSYRDKEMQRAKDSEQAASSAQQITNGLLQHVGSIAKACGATAIFVYVDALDGKLLPISETDSPKIFYVTKTLAEDKMQQDRGTNYLRVPNVPLTRMGQVKIAVFLALSRGLIKRGDKIVFLAGLAESGTLDTLIVTEVGREYEMFAVSDNGNGTPADILPEVIERVVDIASELGKEGREGKAVGALFVIGDTEHVIPLTRQLILNPFKGYPEQQRNILDPALEETIKELATLDGAFIIRADGVIETCGAYLKTASQEEFELPRGLGARHHAAAAITAVTDSIAVTVSESTGTVTIFRGGSIITEIEKPRSIGQKLKRSAIRRRQNSAEEKIYLRSKQHR